MLAKMKESNDLKNFNKKVKRNMKMSARCLTSLSLAKDKKNERKFD